VVEIVIHGDILPFGNTACTSADLFGTIMSEAKSDRKGFDMAETGTLRVVVVAGGGTAGLGAASPLAQAKVTR
jgi:hypothetical protein